MRTHAFILVVGVAGALLVGPASPAPAAVVEGVELRLLSSGLDAPTALAHAGDDRIFVAEQGGRIRVFAGGVLLPTPYLDLRSRVLAGGERGLLGLAFHPRYAENGWLFVSYTRAGDGASVLSRFERAALEPDRADPESEAVLLVVAQPYANHNGGNIAFGPDGFLYLGLGDGGGGGDPECRAQNVDDLLGKMLRLDVDHHAETPPYHAVPLDNPFAGSTPGADLVWALGLRNPWRFSFDRRYGHLIVADVGQGSFDEINFAGADWEGAINWGWKIMEGSACFSRAGCPASTPFCGDESLFLPEVDLPLTDGHCAVIGGYSYHGHRLPLEGRYLFGDHCTGDLWTLRSSAGGLARDDLPFDLPTLTTFGQTRVGEILLATQTGELYALDRPIATSCVPGATRACLRDGRFAVEVSFRDYTGERGDARVAVQSSDSVLFWFFAEQNWEQLVKVLDGCGGVEPRYWVYGAAATDVEVVVRVTDTQHGLVREYNNSLGVRAPALTDAAAFATCP
jgi:glucose/arabinose dehydrogenase